MSGVDWFKEIGSGSELSRAMCEELLEYGFVVIPGAFTSQQLSAIAHAYDLAVAGASPPDLSIGRGTTRVHDLVNRGAEFDNVYLYRPVLEACCRVIGQSFQLSSLLARTVHPHSEEQLLHVDFMSDAEGWPMLGFIVMLDDFRKDNGTTRFVPGSHTWPANRNGAFNDRDAETDQILACGSAGSVIVYNSSVWHGHTANQTSEPRRSIQGAYIRRGCKPWANWTTRLIPETFDRIGPLARYVLAVEQSDFSQKSQRTTKNGN